MIKEHHSVGDFDYSTSYYALDTTYYVSAPSSMHFSRHPSNYVNFCILHDALSGPVEQGRIACWFYTRWLGENRRNMFVFRNLSPDGSAATFPFYAVIFSQTFARFVKYTAWNTYTLIGTFSMPTGYWITANVWRCLRVSWWNGYDLLNNPATVCRLETNISGVWVSGGDLYDTAQLNKGEAIQRCGVGFHGRESGVSNWVDDTEFWLPV